MVHECCVCHASLDVVCRHMVCGMFVCVSLSINCTHLYTSSNILDLWMSPGRVVPLLARWKGRLAGLPYLLELSDPSTATRRRGGSTTTTRRHYSPDIAEPMMLAANRKATLQAIHTDAVNKGVNDQKNNLVLDDLPHPIKLKKTNQEGKLHPRSVYIVNS